MDGRLSAVGKLSGRLGGGSQVGVLTIPKITGGEPYEGEYIVVPNMDIQTLDTTGKVLADDVTVTEIPVSYTENVGGGYTVFIGGV